jgi:hypothetical protein
MKAAVLALLFFLATVAHGMRRVVTTERLLTPLNELYLLSGT